MVRGALGGISSIPLDLANFGGHKLGYGLPMRCSYYGALGGISSITLDLYKSCTNLWSNSGDQVLDLRVLTRGCCSSREAQATPV
jgi:hypothetical protein